MSYTCVRPLSEQRQSLEIHLTEPKPARSLRERVGSGGLGLLEIDHVDARAVDVREIPVASRLDRGDSHRERVRAHARAEDDEAPGLRRVLRVVREHIRVEIRICEHCLDVHYNHGFGQSPRERENERETHDSERGPG